MNPPNKENPIIVRSKKDYIKFADKFILGRGGEATGLHGMTEAAYLAHIRKFWGEPPSYPAMVWTFVTEAAEEVGPTFPETHVRWDTKAELKARLAEFDK